MPVPAMPEGLAVPLQGQGQPHLSQRGQPQPQPQPQVRQVFESLAVREARRNQEIYAKMEGFFLGDQPMICADGSIGPTLKETLKMPIRLRTTAAWEFPNVLPDVSFDVRWDRGGFVLNQELLDRVKANPALTQAIFQTFLNTAAQIGIEYTAGNKFVMKDRAKFKLAMREPSVQERISTLLRCLSALGYNHPENYTLQRFFKVTFDMLSISGLDMPDV
jgi:hypothetical protein